MDNHPGIITESILKAYDDYVDGFGRITGRAGKRFREEDWAGFQADTVERLYLYGRVVDRTVSDLRGVIGETDRHVLLWDAVKRLYDEKIRDRHDGPLAGTFFNSVSRRLFEIVGVNPDFEFTLADFPVPDIDGKLCPDCSPYLDSSDAPDLHRIIDRLFSRFADRLPFRDREGDVRRVVQAMGDRLARQGLSGARIRVEMADPVFYRDKIAYLIGRILVSGTVLPLVICVLNIRGEIFVDAVLLDTPEVSILFSFARSYFHLDVTYPEDLVGFLSTIMPGKRISEIYTSLGYHKHGKAEFYRELMRSLEDTEARFEIARGEKGMVMLVFTFPPFNVVFKVIRDRFDYPKKTTAEHIRNRYDLVFKHDRAGRLIDAQEFKFMRFDRRSFSEEVLEELAAKAKNSVILTDDHLIIRHLYTERRLTPLDLFMRENSPDAVREIFFDYGWAIKELAASNIFPGDLLLKNFGVTRHGRVVFYDYDELSLLTECTFRKMPEPRTYDEIMSDEPWFPVYENDVFPEEFRTFLQIPEYLAEPFERMHGDLFGIDFWVGMQDHLKTRKIIYILPYRRSCRFDNPHTLPASHLFFSNQR